MKKLNGLFSLLLTLAAVFGLTGCPNPAGSDPIPTIDLSKYTIPDEIYSWDESMWDAISDEDFDINRLTDTKWIMWGDYSDPETDEGIVIDTCKILFMTINSTATTASLTNLTIKIYSKENGSDFTTNEISGFIADFEQIKNNTRLKVTYATGKKNIILETADDLENNMIELIKGQYSVDSSNTYMRGPIENGGYEYVIKM